MQTGTPLVKRSITEITADDLTAKDGKTPEDEKPAEAAE